MSDLDLFKVFMDCFTPKLRAYASFSLFALQLVAWGGILKNIYIGYYLSNYP